MLRRRRRLLLLWCVALAGALACDAAPVVDTDLLSHLPTDEAQLQALCARGRQNPITAALCAAQTPSITSLVELQRLFDLSFEDGRRPDFAVTANSSSLTARQVSSINPRAVFMGLPEDRADASYIALAYVRGDQQVELAVTPPDGETAFYLLRYQRGCDDDDDGCSLQERLLNETERGWTRWSIYDDEDMKNSVLDCLQCHQPGGAGTPRMYRMPELVNPWTHWMGSLSRGGRTLLRDFRAAHGVEEVYAGIPGDRMQNANPILLENFVKRTNLATDSEEPISFDSDAINTEVETSSPGHPEVNTQPGRSATWQLLYDRAVAGEALPPPHHDVKITDPALLQTMTEAYVAAAAGAFVGTFPDIRDVIREDAFAALSFRAQPGLDGRQILVHMCAQCHNSKLDQSLSRARFDANDVDGLPRSVKDTAILRLKLPRDDRFAMPPHLFRDLTAEEIDAVTSVLRQ